MENKLGIIEIDVRKYARACLTRNKSKFFFFFNMKLYNYFNKMKATNNYVYFDSMLLFDDKEKIIL